MLAALDAKASYPPDGFKRGWLVEESHLPTWSNGANSAMASSMYIEQLILECGRSFSFGRVKPRKKWPACTGRPTSCVGTEQGYIIRGGAAYTITQAEEAPTHAMGALSY